VIDITSAPYARNLYFLNLQKDYSIYQFLLYVFSQEKEKTYPNTVIVLR